MTAIALSAHDIPNAKDITLLADNPADMLTAQKGLILWCDQKIAVCDAERLEAVGNGSRALAAGWAGEEKRWKRVAGRARLKVEFYSKVKMALEAGYYIVPPFPGQVFAIRRRTDNLRDTYRDGHFNDHEQTEETLPAGIGEYKNPFPQVFKHTDPATKDGQGKTIPGDRFTTAEKFLPMEFPIALVKPEILTATNRALAGKFFDRLSVLPRYRAPDPIVMGEINMPHKKGERVAFFVAWWLDTRSL